MVRRIEKLTLDHLPELSLPRCSSCLHWQLDPVRRSQLSGQQAPDRDAAEKATWVSTLLREWGGCGAVALEDGHQVGHVIWGPSAYLPGLASYPTAPTSPDAVVLANIHVAPAQRGAGLGRQLIRTMAKELVRRKDFKAVEAISSTEPGGCEIPQDFLLAVGFATQRPHPKYPRMRMDLRTTLSLREELELMLDRLLRPIPNPAPESGSGARISSPRVSDRGPAARETG
ncbi:MAG TPA: GNAT family N-acetyltransferase [Marmoricola sp.]|nr:GNAT family N-acetyltransferase [Marmoricola sp.]HNO40325.1 GNAT family N-acetyltransferase [Marmoricola sp.]